MTTEQKEKVIKTFNSKTNREKLQILEMLSKPWIEKGAIKHNAKNLEEIFVMQEISEGAKIIADKKADYLFRTVGGTSMGGSNKMKPKRTRIKRRK